MTDPIAVVVVEDDPDIRVLLDVTFGLSAEFDATVTDPGTVGAWTREWGRYDVLVTDWMMPDHDGADVIATARRHSPGIPAIVLTAREGRRDTFAGLPDDVDIYSKPLAPDDLFAAIRCRHGRR